LINSPADYFTKLLEDDLKAVVKPQYVDQIPRAVRGADKSVKTLIEGRHTLGNLDEVLDTLGRPTPFPPMSNSRLLTLDRASPRL
jgi:translation initiation factor RLI1